MPRLAQSDLLHLALQAVRDCGWTPIIVESAKPFLIRACNGDGAWLDLRVYIWNCTHGGKNRAPDEFRIQFTSTVPTTDPNAATLLMGWHDEKGVFAAWDIAAHEGQASSSPSAQIKEWTLAAASEKAFAVQRKDNEIVVAFRPAFLMDYALARASLHKTGAAEADNALLNELPDLTDKEIDAIADRERRKIVRTITTRFRARTFRGRVLTAYGHRCAFCSVQLSLLDAAHIVPVAAPGSTDEIVNGVALCKLHHFAYDENLVSFDASYAIEVSAARLGELSGRHGGLPGFRSALGGSLALPAQERHYPKPEYIRSSRKVRGWRD